MRPGRGAQLVDELHTAGDRGRETDAVVGPEDVVVHRLRHGNHRYAFAGKPGAVRKGVVAADRDQPVQAEPIDHRQAVVGEVEGTFGFALALTLEELRHVPGLDLGGIRSAGVQERPAGAIDGAYVTRTEWLGALDLRLGRVEVVVEQAGPTSPQTDDLIAAIDRAVDERFDARVQSGDIATAGQHSDAGHDRGTPTSSAPSISSLYWP